MIEKILEILTKCWGWVTPLLVIDAYQGAAVLRWGTFNRSLGPGLHWKWPIAEEAYIDATCVTTMRMPPQTLTTKDDVAVVVQAMVKYQIVDMKPYVTEIYDQKDVLGDVTMGAIRAAVQEHTWLELKDSTHEATIVELVRKECNRYGFKIHKITFTDFGRVVSLRLMQQAPKDLDN